MIECPTAPIFEMLSHVPSFPHSSKSSKLYNYLLYEVLLALGTYFTSLHSVGTTAAPPLIKCLSHSTESIWLHCPSITGKDHGLLISLSPVSSIQILRTCQQNGWMRQFVAWPFISKAGKAFLLICSGRWPSNSCWEKEHIKNSEKVSLFFSLCPPCIV